MPSYILGAVPDAAMNLVYPLGIYAAVTAHLRTTLDFPADLNAWDATNVGSSSMLNAYLEEWAVLNDDVQDEKFNAADGGPFTWGGFWPKLAGWYGVELGRPSLESGDYTEVRTRFEPPPRGCVSRLLSVLPCDHSSSSFTTFFLSCKGKEAHMCIVSAPQPHTASASPSPPGRSAPKSKKPGYVKSRRTIYQF